MKKKLARLSLASAFKLQGVERKLIYIICISLFVVINVITANVNGVRIDASKGQAYTLTPATQKILDNLDDLVTIKFIATSDIPSNLVPVRWEVDNLLREYGREAGGKVTVQNLDPKRDENAVAQAQEYGVPELQFSQMEQDRYAVSAARFGIVVVFGDKHETIPQVLDPASLEYTITAAINKLTSKETPRVGTIGLSPAMSQAPGGNSASTLEQILASQFTLEPVTLTATDDQPITIDPAIKTVLLFDDRIATYDEKQITALKDYVAKGGRLITFVDGVWVSDNLQTSEAGHGLFPFIAQYGITLNKDLVLSQNAELLNFGSGGPFAIVQRYPLWFITTNANTAVPYFTNVTQMTFPWASSLTLSEKNGAKPQFLVKTTEPAWNQTSSYILNPQDLPEPVEADIKEFVVAAEAPAGKGKIAVIGSSRFVIDQFMTRTSNNLGFVVNLLNEYASGALAGIRARSVDYYPLPQLSDAQKDFFKYGNIVALPLLLTGYAAFRLSSRRKAR